VNIKRGNTSFYIGDNEEAPLAKINFLDNGTNIIIDHTFVSEELRGQNIGRLLLHKVVDLARQNNKKIIPHCSYVKAVFEKTPDYEDIVYK
jgi:predicted GNAT family acetyltransferase